MNELLGTAWALPVGGIALAVVGYGWLRFATYRFGQKYGQGR